MKIPHVRLVPEATESSTNIGFEYAPKEIGTRHRIGGDPDWIQDEETIICDDCKEKMVFYAQVDSLSDDVIIGDCGMVYVFICFDCLTTKSIIQSF